ncbi:hypothetical protein WA588_004186 [Blastocystis sp. NMH]
MSSSIAPVTSTVITIQKFLSAFLDRLSKARFAIETVDSNKREVEDMRQLSTRIIQQWNKLFPNSLIKSSNDLSANLLIATKTREEVVLDRTNQQKQQLMIEVEVLRSRWQQLQQESAQLKEEIAQSNSDINVATSSLQQLQKDRHSLVSTLSSLQLQKQHEDAELRNLQSAKLRILEELVAEQQAASSLRTSLQTLKQEKDAQTKELERMRNEQILISRELEVLHQQSAEATVNHTNTTTETARCDSPSAPSSQTTPCLTGSSDPLSNVFPIQSVSRRNRRLPRKRRSQRRVVQRLNNQTNLFADDIFW